MEFFSVTPFGGLIPPDVRERLHLQLVDGGFLGKPPMQPEQLLWALSVGDVMRWDREEPSRDTWRARILRSTEVLPRPDVARVRVFVRRSNGFFELY